MKILALDTCTPAGSVALLEEDRLLGSFLLNVETTHSERLLPVIDQLLAQAGWAMEEIDLIACARGPGGFTGLRIGLSTAKGLAFAAGKPLVGVNSLEAMALGLAYSTTAICPMIDARKRQVFAALFQPDGQGRLQRLREDVSTEAAVYAQSIQGPCLFVGNGAELFAADIRRAKPGALLVDSALCYPRAVGIAILGKKQYQSGERGLVAHYVRASDAELNPKFAEKET